MSGPQKCHPRWHHVERYGDCADKENWVRSSQQGHLLGARGAWRAGGDLEPLSGDPVRDWEFKGSGAQALPPGVGTPTPAVRLGPAQLVPVLLSGFGQFPSLGRTFPARRTGADGSPGGQCLCVPRAFPGALCTRDPGTDPCRLLSIWSSVSACGHQYLGHQTPPVWRRK